MGMNTNGFATFPPNADRLVVVMGDIEMGAGGVLDDFPHSDALGELILSYTRPPFDQLPVELVFNGDTFDLLKTSYEGEYPRHVTRDVALAKMSRVAAAHPRFFSALRRFLESGSAPRQVNFVYGNHDQELFFPEVQKFIQTLCGNAERVLFPGLQWEHGKVLVEHGAQYDKLFRVDPDRPFVKHNGEDILNVPWGTVALLDTVMPLQPLLYFHDRLKPKRDVFAMMPEVKDLLMALFWKYWTKDYWKGFFGGGDPTKRLTWSMLKELVRRITYKDPDVYMDGSLERRIRESDSHRLYVVGHVHQAGWWGFGDRKVIQAGCLRNEYMLADEGRLLRPIPKSYCEVFMKDDEPVLSRLVELTCPEPPEGYIPESIFDVLPQVREMLAEQTDRKKVREAEQAQEEKEAQEAS